MSNSPPSITCPACGMSSRNPNDIREGYCGHCHDWTGAVVTQLGNGDPHTYRAALWARAVALLGDGRWHNYEATILELGKVIPPGMAVRKCEQERRGQGRSQRGGRSAPPARLRDLPIETQIANGRRSLVRIFLKSVRFETDRPGDPSVRVAQRRVRMIRPPAAGGAG